MKIFTDFGRLVSVLGLLLVGNGISSAAFVNCPTDTKCNGNVYTIASGNVGGNIFDIAVSIDTTGYTGSATNAGLGAIQLQSFTSAAFTIVSFTASGGNNNLSWSTIQSGLGTDGCDPAPTPGTARFCASNTAPFLFDKGDFLSFVFRVNLTSGGSINNVIHIKNLFLKN